MFDVILQINLMIYDKYIEYITEVNVSNQQIFDNKVFQRNIGMKSHN